MESHYARFLIGSRMPLEPSEKLTLTLTYDLDMRTCTRFSPIHVTTKQ